MNENNENPSRVQSLQSNWTSLKDQVTSLINTYVTMQSCSNCLCCTGALTFSCGCGLVTLYLLAANTALWTDSDVTVNFKTFSVPGYVLVFIGQFELFNNMFTFSNIVKVITLSFIRSY